MYCLENKRKLEQQNFIIDVMPQEYNFNVIANNVN